MLTLTIPGRMKARKVADFVEASAVYADAREKSGLGGSKFRGGTITRDDEEVATISYNGRVWVQDNLVYCPGSVNEDDGRPDIFNEGREAVWGTKKANPYMAGTLKHRVFEKGVARAKACYR